jgi:hypothetical protein
MMTFATPRCNPTLFIQIRKSRLNRPRVGLRLNRRHTLLGCLAVPFSFFLSTFSPLGLPVYACIVICLLGGLWGLGWKEREGTVLGWWGW